MTSKSKVIILNITFGMMIVVFLTIISCIDYMIDRHEYGKWGRTCRPDNTCNTGLVCVTDVHPKYNTYKRSICLNLDTMRIGR